MYIFHIKNARNIYLNITAKFKMIRSLEIGSHHKDFRKLLKFIETLLSLYPWDLIGNFFQIQAIWSIVGFYVKFRKVHSLGE